MATDRPIYLDHAATTPVDPRVLDAMLPFFKDVFGNAASRSHAYGWEAEAAVDTARQQAADLIGASPKEIVWTSGATESNNIAVKGGARMYAKKGPGESGRGHVITSATEHKAVIDPARRLEKEGFDVTFLRPGADGVITAKMVEDVLRDDTILVSLMWANNEIGTINEVPEIGRLCRARDVVFHTDATQWVGKMPVDVNADNIDVLSWSGHKIYGPKGVGAMYVRRKNPRVRLEPIFDGGGHERGIRSGTINVPGVVGFGAACELCRQEMEQDRTRLLALRNKLENGLNEKLEAVFINGHPERRLPNLSNISFGFVEGESLMMGAKEIACSSGSACTSASLEPSYVLKALGVNDELAHSSLRLSMGRWTTDEEIDRTIDVLVKAVTHLRELSPLWDLYKEGVDLSTIEWQSH